MKDGDRLIAQIKLNQLAEAIERREKARKFCLAVFSLGQPYYRANNKYWEQALCRN